jgi:N-methylhydantoinase A
MGADAELGGELSIDAGRARDVLGALAETAGLADAEEAALGVYRVTNAAMTRAIRAVTVERGHDPREFGLVAFGGAGPMHAASLADRLDVDRIVVPESAGVLSAHGLLAADESHDRLRTVRLGLAEATPAEGEAVYEDLEERVLESVSDPEAARIERAADCRYEGQSFELTVPLETFDPDRVAEAFEALHEQTYGYRLDAAVEAVTLRVTATIETEPPAVTGEGGGDATRGSRSAVFPGHGSLETAVYDRAAIDPGTVISAPAILEQAESTTVVPPGWRGKIRRDGALLMEATGDGETDADTAGPEGSR